MGNTESARPKLPIGASGGMLKVEMIAPIPKNKAIHCINRFSRITLSLPLVKSKLSIPKKMNTEIFCPMINTIGKAMKKLNQKSNFLQRNAIDDVLPGVIVLAVACTCQIFLNFYVPINSGSYFFWFMWECKR